MKNADLHWFARTYNISLLDFCMMFNVGEKTVHKYFENKAALRKSTIRKIDLALQALEENKQYLPQHVDYHGYSNKLDYRESYGERLRKWRVVANEVSQKLNEEEA